MKYGSAALAMTIARHLIFIKDKNILLQESSICSTSFRGQLCVVWISDYKISSDCWRLSIYFRAGWGILRALGKGVGSCVAQEIVYRLRIFLYLEKPLHIWFGWLITVPWGFVPIRLRGRCELLPTFGDLKSCHAGQDPVHWPWNREFVLLETEVWEWS